jgi:hypothetical protein
MRALFVSVIACAACHDPAPPAPVTTTTPPPATVDPQLATEREEFISDAMVFVGVSHDEAVKKLDADNKAMRDEWTQWEKEGPMTDDRIKAFYKQTKSYIWDLGSWHLYNLDKRQSDVATVQQMKDLGAKTILDFGGGVGLNSLMLARAGFDVTLADLDSQTLAFGKLRAERHNVKLRFWKTDVEPAPPEAKYDVILCLDVLEHLPQAELASTVDKLIKLKTPKTQIIIHAPFGKTATHPMHLDETEETKRQIERLKTELPKA